MTDKHAPGDFGQGESFAAIWQLYHDKVISQDAKPIQRLETKRGFYAGALVVFNLNAGLAGLPTSEAVHRWRELADELETVGAQLGLHVKEEPTH